MISSRYEVESLWLKSRIPSTTFPEKQEFFGFTVPNWHGTIDSYLYVSVCASRQVDTDASNKPKLVSTLRTVNTECWSRDIFGGNAIGFREKTSSRRTLSGVRGFTEKSGTDASSRIREIWSRDPTKKKSLPGPGEFPGRRVVYAAARNFGFDYQDGVNMLPGTANEMVFRDELSSNNDGWEAAIRSAAALADATGHQTGIETGKWLRSKAVARGLRRAELREREVEKLSRAPPVLEAFIAAERNDAGTRSLIARNSSEQEIQARATRKYEDALRVHKQQQDALKEKNDPECSNFDCCVHDEFDRVQKHMLASRSSEQNVAWGFMHRMRAQMKQRSVNLILTAPLTKELRGIAVSLLPNTMEASRVWDAEDYGKVKRLVGDSVASCMDAGLGLCPGEVARLGLSYAGFEGAGDLGSLLQEVGESLKSRERWNERKRVEREFVAKHYPGEGDLEGETRSSARRLAEDEGFRTALLLTPDPNYADVSLDLAQMGKAMSDARRVYLNTVF